LHDGRCSIGQLHKPNTTDFEGAVGNLLALLISGDGITGGVICVCQGWTGIFARATEKRDEVEESRKGIESKMENEAVSLRLVEDFFHLMLRSLGLGLERVAVPVNLSAAPLVDLLAVP
jgi:hypothetical protein